jgi:CheY-like chemotaxis protein
MQAATPRILVLDDDEAFRQTVVKLLEAAGFEVLEAINMGDVLTKLEQAAPPVDLLLADLRLAPGTPHGFSIARVVQMRHRSVKIVFMTGGDPQGFALAGPGDIVLHKPFRAHTLVETIKAALSTEPA